MTDSAEKHPWHHGPRRPRIATLAIVLLALLIQPIVAVKSWQMGHPAIATGG
jgi:hypothetical protein